MALNAETIEGFVKSLLLSNFDDPCEIPDCHREWWEACCSPNKFVAIAAPRGFAKSTAITHSYLLAKVLFRESRFAIIVSDSESQASLFLNDIKKELTINDNLRSFFGIESFIKDTEADIIVKFVDGHEFRILAKGSEQKLRGLKWGNKRPDLIICDDMENDELVMNKERREKLKKWFSSALLPVRSDRGIIRMVGTILHADSLLESFMPKEGHPGVVVTPLKVYSKLKTAGWYALKYRAHSKNFEMLLWGQKRSKDELLAIRDMYKLQGLLDVYSQEYLNNPIDESNTHFRRSDFLNEKPEDKDKPLTYYVTFDGAWSLSQQADYTAILVSGMDSEGFIYLKHMIRDRIDPLEFADLLFDLVNAYDPVMVVSEKGAYANSVMPAINKRMEESDRYFRMELLNPATDKVHRSQAIRLRARAGKVKVDRTKDWWPDFEDEIMLFPRGGKDDQVDAFSLVGLTLNKFYEAPTLKEMQQEAIDEEKQESGFFEIGRSEMTGY